MNQKIRPVKVELRPGRCSWLCHHRRDTPVISPCRKSSRQSKGIVYSPDKTQFLHDMRNCSELHRCSLWSPVGMVGFPRCRLLLQLVLLHLDCFGELLASIRQFLNMEIALDAWPKANVGSTAYPSTRCHLLFYAGHWNVLTSQYSDLEIEGSVQSCVGLTR